MGVVPPNSVDEGHKVKGTETCGHTMMDLGTSLMTSSKKKSKLPSACDFHVGQTGTGLLWDL